MLAAHRSPPQLIGIVPNNTDGFGSVCDAAIVYAANEIGPLQERMWQLNGWLGEEVFASRLTIWRMLQANVLRERLRYQRAQ